MADVIKTKSEFSLGSLVLAATDSLLGELGYAVKDLGPLAIGVVIEESSKRAHVHFPELKVSLWLDHSEIKDVLHELQRDDKFKPLQKYVDETPGRALLPFLMHFLIQFLFASHVLGVDHGPLDEVWEEAPDKLAGYFQGNLSVDVMRLSLGLEEMNPAKIEELKKILPERLLITRFLPSGMYKFEVSLYLKRNV
ncbi:MAG: hypothetical protein R3A80_02735 [Bdellovibrionota bacterium]